MVTFAVPIAAARQNLLIQRDAVSAQVNKYNGQVAETPQQERMLTQIDRQQEVKSGTLPYVIAKT